MLLDAVALDRGDFVSYHVAGPLKWRTRGLSFAFLSLPPKIAAPSKSTPSSVSAPVMGAVVEVAGGSVTTADETYVLSAFIVISTRSTRHPMRREPVHQR